MLRGLIVSAVVVAAVLGLYAVTVSQTGASCEACMVFEGRRACRSASAANEEEARQHAVATACALVTAGVTQDLACQRSAPESLRCE